MASNKSAKQPLYHHSGPPYRTSGLFVSWFQLTVCHVKLQNVASCRLASNAVFDIEKELHAVVHGDEAIALRSKALASSREGACALHGTTEAAGSPCNAIGGATLHILGLILLGVILPGAMLDIARQLIDPFDSFISNKIHINIYIRIQTHVMYVIFIL